MTRTSADRGPLLLDTSTAVAFLVAGHTHHEETFTALAERELGLAGHSAFETYSVLTRLPSPGRLSPAAARRLLEVNFPHTRFLSPEGTARLLTGLPELAVSGGSVYDALVAAAAQEHDLPLATRDRRALATYRAIGPQLVLL